MSSISASVGVGGENREPDVRLVQELLERAGLNPGRIDGRFGIRTRTAIVSFQSRFLRRPDGLVSPGGPTMRRLVAAGQAPRKSAPLAPGSGLPSRALLAADWGGDSARWSQEKKLASLNAGFRSKVEATLRALREADYQPTVVYGWRSVAVQRALYDTGKTRVLFSFHNAQTPEGLPNAWAADIVDVRWMWREPDCHKFFKALGTEAKKQGLVWGGDWKGFPDWAHVQGRQNGELALVKRESGF